MPRIERGMLLERFQGMVSQGEPIVGGGAGRTGTPKAHIVGGAQFLEHWYASREGWMVVGGARGIVGG